jgi:hypothetical protein
MNKLEIPFSKTKMLLLIIIGFAFVAIGIILIISPEAFVSTFFRDSRIVLLSGFISILFFGWVSIINLKKLFSNSIGLRIDENGIYDNTNPYSVGLINWKDIVEIRSKKYKSSKFLLIFVSNPNYYLEKTKGIKRDIVDYNMSVFETPLYITTNSLKYKHRDLELLLNKKLKEFAAIRSF